MFDAHRSSASGNVTYLICHMTSQDHVIERSCEVTDGSTPLYVTILPSLMAIGIVVVEICFSFFKLSQRPCDFTNQTPSKSVTNLACLVAIGTMVVDI